MDSPFAVYGSSLKDIPLPVQTGDFTGSCASWTPLPGSRNGRWRHLFTLKADMPQMLATTLSGGPLALLPDGTVAVLTVLPSGGRGTKRYELFDDEVRREKFMEVYNAAVPSQHIGPELLTIIREQIQPCFAVDKSVAETAALIQSQAQL